MEKLWHIFCEANVYMREIDDSLIKFSFENLFCERFLNQKLKLKHITTST